MERQRGTGDRGATERHMQHESLKSGFWLRSVKDWTKGNSESFSCFWQKLVCLSEAIFGGPPQHRSAAVRSFHTSKVRGGSWEELRQVRGKEQRLCFAGVSMKRYPMSKVRELQVRWQALREGIRGQTDRNHNHRQLANVITWTTACLTQWN